MNRYRFQGAHLKWIALISMLIDHSAVLLVHPYIHLYPNTSAMEGMEILYFWMRLLGRIAFPLFAFLLVEGVKHTSSPLKYGIRLLIAALVSEIPFDMARQYRFVDFSYQNVFFTLFFGLVCIEVLRWMEEQQGKGRSYFGFLRLLALFFFVAAAELLHTDYGGVGVVVILLMYTLFLQRGFFEKWLAFLISLVPLFLISQTSLAAAVCAPLIQGYDGTRGKQNKYFFYLFYPLHLLLLVLLRGMIY
ncbi:MAG: conjugal transfer protein TraX [Anaeroplasma sp.]|nr:conjugal transfer protein TraX [Anaeroplasma sp.]